MRDDIHKGAPVRPGWRTVARDCTLEASWRENAPKHAEAALIDELRGAIRPKFLKSLDAKLYGYGQLALTEPPIDPRDLRLSAKSPIEKLIVDHALEAISRGASRREAHEQGFVGAIREFKDSICLAVEAHASLKEPGSARLLAARLRHSLTTVGTSLPQKLLKGRLPPRIVRQKPAPSLDIALPVKGARGAKRAE